MTNLKRLANVLIMTALLLTTAAGCREVNGTLYASYHDIGEEGLAEGGSMVFVPEIADSMRYGKEVRMELMIRYRAHKPMGQIPFLLMAEDENGDICSDTLMLSLFDHEGMPRDPARFGLCRHSLTVLPNFPLRRNLSVCIMSLVPREATDGLQSIGIKISANGPYSSSSGKP